MIISVLFYVEKEYIEWIWRQMKFGDQVCPGTIDGKLRGLETAISISQSKNSLSLWYDNGLVVDISLDSGIEIDRRILQTLDRIERVFHSEKFHLLALAGGGFLISDGEQILESY